VSHKTEKFNPRPQGH